MAAKRKTGTAPKTAAAPAPTGERAERGPSLMWTPARDAALVKAVRDLSKDGGRATQQALYDHLKNDPAFTDLEDPSVLTPYKLSLRCGHLRGQKIPIPYLGRQRYTPDVEGLKALLSED